MSNSIRRKNFIFTSYKDLNISRYLLHLRPLEIQKDHLSNYIHIFTQLYSTENLANIDKNFKSHLLNLLNSYHFNSCKDTLILRNSTNKVLHIGIRLHFHQSLRWKISYHRQWDNFSKFNPIQIHFNIYKHHQYHSSFLMRKSCYN